MYFIKWQFIRTYRFDNTLISLQTQFNIALYIRQRAYNGRLRFRWYIWTHSTYLLSPCVLQLHYCIAHYLCWLTCFRSRRLPRLDHLGPVLCSLVSVERCTWASWASRWQCTWAQSHGQRYTAAYLVHGTTKVVGQLSCCICEPNVHTTLDVTAPFRFPLDWTSICCVILQTNRKVLTMKYPRLGLRRACMNLLNCLKSKPCSRTSDCPLPREDGYLRVVRCS